MDGPGRGGAHAEHGAEEVGARAQVLLRAQELHGGALLLQRVVWRRRAGNLDVLGGELERLRGVWRELDRAPHHHGGAHVLVRDVLVAGKLVAAHDHLKVAEA